MRSRTWVPITAVAAVVAPMLTVVGATSSAADDGRAELTARPLTASSQVSTDKAASSRLARTDPRLLGRTDDKQINVVVKLDYDAVAAYSGDITGLAATSPSVTGKPLRGSASEQRYESWIAGKERAFRAAVQKRVPDARVGQSLRTVYGGVAMRLPANQVSDVLSLPGVVAVQKDAKRKLLTDASPHFIGADTWDKTLGGSKNAGKGIIFGSLDSGVWPEHPSFADQGNLSAPPRKADGTARTCDFGDNPLTTKSDVFRCNHKLIGGAPFIDTYLEAVGDEAYETARDSDGHGTHTASTTAGDVVRSAKVLGVERGPIRGVAPGAWVSVYKVCGAQGCFSSDSVAAVAQAIKDGVNVINYSISGGGDPYTDPVELAFLDAYAAGVFVAASAGNSGPGEATTDHVSPWVTTVAASTQRRAFTSTLTLRAGRDTLTLKGASITQGVSGPLPVVVASSADIGELCDGDPVPGKFTDKIVVCKRGTNARVDKGYRVAQSGGAGMILYNPTLADVETDNHWLPAIHLADGTAMMAWLGSHAGVTGSFTAGQKSTGKADVMAAFSSRGPGGLGIKPDITAPGVEILAGNTPTPDSTDLGPEGQYYQAIAGTSMSSPHIAGSAVLVKALHPGWSPAQIKSALMSTARTAVVKEDETTHADPFDYGSGRVDLTRAPRAGLTFDETADRMFALGADSVHAIDLNLASVDAPVMPGEVRTTRTVTNVTSKKQTYRVKVTAPKGSTIHVSPTSFTLRSGRSTTLSVRISSTAPTAQYFGQIRLVPTSKKLPKQHLPVAFVPRQGGVTLSSSCAPATIEKGATSTCTVSAANQTSTDTTATIRSTVSKGLEITKVTGATRTGRDSVWLAAPSLAAGHPGLPSIAPGDSPAGYVPLAEFGIPAEAVGDEDIVNYDVPAFEWAGETYTRVGVTTNGYLVVGGGTAQDVQFEPTLPSPDRPNNVIAPFWTDLNGDGAPGISAGSLTDGVSSWIVVQWDVNVWGTDQLETFQTWIGTNGVQDVSLVYDPDNLPTEPEGQDFAVGVENREGGGQALPAGELPTTDLVASSTEATPGAAVSYTVTVRGTKKGTSIVSSQLISPVVPGTTRVSSTVRVTDRRS